MQASGKQFVSVENSMGVVHSSQGRLKPISTHLLSEPAIVAGLAKATLKDKGNVEWHQVAENYDIIRNMIQATIPGFENYNERVRDPQGFVLPNGARNADFSSIGGKAKFTVNEIPDNKLKQGEFHMTTVRTHDQFNTTIYGLNDRYRGIFNERRVILMNEEDMKDQTLEKGDVVDLWNEHNGIKRCAPRFLVVPYSVLQKCTVTYFPETNVLVPIDSVADKSNTPTSKLVKITIKKVIV